jgi:uncharacterized membrane protein
MKFILNRLFVLKIILYGFLVYFIYLLGLITLQYIPIRYDVAFLNIKQEEIRLTYYKLAFFSHVYTSILVISLGLTQFSKTIRSRFSFVHKLSGKVYVILILLVACPSGLVMAYHANGGLISQTSFTILSILWFTFTLKAYTAIKKGEFQKHKNFMIRSYALTLSAVSLRLFKYGIVSIFELPPMDTYQIVSVLGWVVNLGIAELIIRKTADNKLQKKHS